MTDDTLKVSVVIATYAPGKGLDRLIASLDAQTLPCDQWEAIFVDDGSPDDTFARLQVLARSRPHMRVERIENSGWPCRPRNVGTDLALGEYIAYMDHDDELYPDALRAGYAFAKANGADVLNGKEARTHDPGWAIDQYRADAGQAKYRTDSHPLIPTNPHKLYRRQFLNDNGIRFLEGGRVLWEDIFFNVQVAKHAAVISTMASTPYYHWFATPGSGSTSFRRSRTEWWEWLERVIIAIDTDLAAPELGHQRMLLRSHQYKSRLMDSFNNLYERRPAHERAMIFAHAHHLQSAYFPAEEDAALTRNLRMRAQLLRAGDAALLESLTIDDPNIPALPHLVGARWVNGTLRVDTAATWIDSTGRRFRYVVRDGRIVKDLPPKYDGIFDAGLLDVTDDIEAATVELGLRARRSRITWMAPSWSEAWWKGTASGVEFGVTGTGIIDPSTAAAGNLLERGEWELNARCTLGGTVQHRIARGLLTPAIHLDEAGAAAVYTRSDGVVVLDFDQTRTPLPQLITATGSARRRNGQTYIAVEGLPAVEKWSGSTKVEINDDPLPKRAARIPGRALRKLLGKGPGRRGWRSVPAMIVVEGERSELVIDLPSDASIRIRIGQRVPGAEVTLTLLQGHGALLPIRGRLARLLS